MKTLLSMAVAAVPAEAHGGSVTLENRSAGSGCVATLRLPLLA